MGGTVHEYAKTLSQTIKKLKYVPPGTKKQNWGWEDLIIDAKSKHKARFEVGSFLM